MEWLCLNKSTPGAEGLITIPFFTGERTPNLPNAKACLLGLDDQNTGTTNILRSAVEGVTYGLKYGLGRLADNSVRAETIILTQFLESITLVNITDTVRSLSPI